MYVVKILKIIFRKVEMFSIAFITLLASMSPGPDFAIVSRYSLLGSRRAGLYAALGVAMGAAIHGMCALLGLGTLMTYYPVLLRVVQCVGGGYLIYMGYAAFRSLTAKRVSQVDEIIQHRKAFRDGFVCNVLNPKAMLFVLALFTQLIPHEEFFIKKLGYSIEMVLIIFAWFAVISLFFSYPIFQRALHRLQKPITGITGIFFVLLGARLLFFH